MAARVEIYLGHALRNAVDESGAVPSRLVEVLKKYGAVAKNDTSTAHPWDFEIDATRGSISLEPLIGEINTLTGVCAKVV
jgi:hypothetical protein